MTHFSVQAQEEADFTVASEAEADRFDAFRGIAHRCITIWGSDIPSDQAWVLSGRDVWYANPAYVGPAVPHPFENEYADEDAWYEDGDAPTTPADYDDIPF